MEPPRAPPATILPSAWTIIGMRFSAFVKIVFSAAEPTRYPVPLNVRSSCPSASAAAGAARNAPAIVRVRQNAREKRRRMIG